MRNNCFTISDVFELFVRGTLKEIKAKLRKHLKVLEEEGIVLKDDGYQGIITSVAKDICNRNKYRQIQIKVSTNINILMLFIK